MKSVNVPLTFATHGTELALTVLGLVSPVLLDQMGLELRLRKNLEALDTAGAAGVGVNPQEVRVQVPLDYLGGALGALHLCVQLELFLVAVVVVLVAGRLQDVAADAAFEVLGGSANKMFYYFILGKITSLV